MGCHLFLFEKKQRGVALITALLVVSLATIMAVSLMSRQYIDIRRTGNMLQSDQAYLDAIAAETFVGQLLANVRSQGESTFDDISQFDLALMQLSGDMSDDSRIVTVQAQYPEARFNVNTLINKDNQVNAKQKEIYRRLLSSIMLDLGESTGQVDELVSSLMDWLDKDEEARIDGAEDSVYESKTPPYKAANRMLASISELRLIEGYTAELLEGTPADKAQEIEAIPGLLAYVDALPYKKSVININALSDAKIIAALSSRIDLNMAETLFEGIPFEKISEFTNHDILAENDGELTTGEQSLSDEMSAYQGSLTVQSQYFMIKNYVTVGKITANLNSLIFVAKNGTKLEVISRAMGTNGI